MKGVDDRTLTINSKQRLIEEATRMKNCVTSYARKVMDGRCALYHVLYRGRHYTMEVIPGHRRTLHLGELAGVSNKRPTPRLRTLVTEIIEAQ